MKMVILNEGQLLLPDVEEGRHHFAPLCHVGRSTKSGKGLTSKAQGDNVNFFLLQHN